MAIAKVQETQNAQAGGVAATISVTPSATTAGSLLVLVWMSGYTNTLTSVTDDQSNTWTIPAGATAADPGGATTGKAVSFAYAYNATAGVTSVTAHSGNNNAIQVKFFEFSGVMTASNPIDDTQRSPTAAISLPTASVPTILQSGSNGLFIAEIAIDAANLTGVAGGFTYDAYAVQFYQGIAWMVSSDSSSHTPAWVNPANQNATYNGISFKTPATTNPTTMELVF